MASQKKGEALPALVDVLETLTERRKRLDEADTRISNLIKEAEVELQTHFNVRVWTDITDRHNGSAETALVFGKHDGKWQLLVESSYGNDESITPLLSCTRELRVRVFSEGHLEDLIRGAAAQLDKQLAVRESAIEKATELVRALGGLPF